MLKEMSQWKYKLVRTASTQKKFHSYFEECLCPSTRQGIRTKKYPSLLFGRHFPASLHTGGLKLRYKTIIGEEGLQQDFILSTNHDGALVFGKTEHFPSSHAIFGECRRHSTRQGMGTRCTPQANFEDSSPPLYAPDE